MAGPSGVGKTALYCGWVRSLLDGGTILGAAARLEGEQAIGIVFADRALENNRHWLDRFGLYGEPRVGIYSIVDDSSFPLRSLRVAAEHPKLFRSCVDKLLLPPGSLLIVDPISLFLGGKLIDYACTAAAMLQLQRIAKERQLTILGVHHVSKQKDDPKSNYRRPQDRILGSGALLGFSDTQFWMIGPEETRKPYYWVGYASHSEVGRRFEFSRDKLGRFVQVTQDPLEKLKKEAKGDQNMAILRLIDVEPTPILAVVAAAEALGVSRAAVYRTLDRLMLAGGVTKDGVGRYRRLVELKEA